MRSARRRDGGRLRPRWLGVSTLAIAILTAVTSSLAAAKLITRSSTSEVPVWTGDPDTGSASHTPRSCDRYGEAVSGGFANPDFSRATSTMYLFGFNPTQGRPVGSSWRATVVNLGTAANGSGTLRVFAYCAVRERPRLFRRTATTTIRGRHTGGATARCPRGSEAMSGGFSMLPRRGENPYYPYVKLFGYESRRIGNRRWHASAVNMKRHGKDRFIVLVKCDPRVPGLRGRSKQVEVPTNGTASVGVSCGDKRKAVSGGFEGKVRVPSGDGTFPFRLNRITHRRWRAAAFDEGTAAPFTAYVYCGRRHRR
jgi:hypothetical protein